MTMTKAEKEAAKAAKLAEKEAATLGATIPADPVNVPATPDIPTATSDRKAAWERFRANMEKYDKPRHDRLKGDGYFDQIDPNFTN